MDGYAWGFRVSKSQIVDAFKFSSFRKFSGRKGGQGRGETIEKEPQRRNGWVELD